MVTQNLAGGGVPVLVGEVAADAVEVAVHKLAPVGIACAVGSLDCLCRFGRTRVGGIIFALCRVYNYFHFPTAGLRRMR